jgi:broad specificity phosphatase PhoE
VRVVLVRHGQTNWNTEDKYRGRIDVKLNKRGVHEARLIGKKLSKIPVSGIYSSPLLRALDTSHIIANFHTESVQILEELIDIDFGVWQGMERDEVIGKYPEIYSMWIKNPDRVKIPGAESLDDVRNRVIGCLNFILSKQGSETVFVISHGLVNKVILCAVLGLDNSFFWKVKQDNGAVSVFEYSEYGSKVFLMNDTSHLRSLQEIIDNMRDARNPIG